MANKVEYIKISEIYIDKDRLWNAYEKDLESLKESVEAVGLITPIAIQKRDKGFKLIAGEHRLTVCKQLGWEEIPAHIIERKYDDDEIEDARLEVMEADENIKRKKGDFIAEGLILKRRSKAYNKVIAAEFGIDLSKQTPEQYKKTLKNKLDRIKRKEEDKTGSGPGTEPAKEKKEIENTINTLKTFKEDVQEKTGLSEETINKKLRIAEVFEDKIDLLKELDANKVSEKTLRTLAIGKDINEVKEAVEIHGEILKNLELPKKTNVNTYYRNAIKKTKEIVGDKEFQQKNPIAFAEKLKEVVTEGTSTQEKKEFIQLTNRELDDINIELAAHEADEITITVNGKVIYERFLNN